MDNETNRIIERLKSKKPRCIYIDKSKSDALKNPDCLSLEFTIFRNGGNVGTQDVQPFVELTPELLNLFRAIWEGK